MDEIKVEIALEVIQLKIVHLLKNKDNKDRNTIKEELNRLIDEREKIYELNEEVINKVYDVYLEEIKNNRED